MLLKSTVFFLGWSRWNNYILAARTERWPRISRSSRDTCKLHKVLLGCVLPKREHEKYCYYSTIGNLMLGHSYVFLEMQGSHLMYLWFMAWGKVCDSILLLIGWPTEAKNVPWSGRWYPADNSTQSLICFSAFPVSSPFLDILCISSGVSFPSLLWVGHIWLSGCSCCFGWWEGEANASAVLLMLHLLNSVSALPAVLCENS